MNARLPLFALALASSLYGANVAEAGHFHGGFHAGGSVHFGGGGWHGGGGVSVHSSWGWSRPAYHPSRWHVGGSIYVGPTYTYYPRPYYYYYPSYVPSYYASTSYYPVEAYSGPSYAPVAVYHPPLPRFGVGLFGGGSEATAADGGSSLKSDDLGLLARFRLTPGLLIEGELGKMSYDEGSVDNVRVDRRLGGSLVYEIGAYNSWAPYVLAGLGVQQADTAGEYKTTQDYAEIGIGLRWAVSRSFHLTADIRAGSRATVSDNTETMPAGTVARTIAPPSSTSGQTEDYTRGRLSAILYF